MTASGDGTAKLWSTETRLYYEGCIAIVARDYAWFLSDAQIPVLEYIYEEEGVSGEDVSEEDGIPVVPATSTTSGISFGTCHGRLGGLPYGCRQRRRQKSEDRTGQ